MAQFVKSSPMKMYAGTNFCLVYWYNTRMSEHSFMIYDVRIFGFICGLCTFFEKNYKVIKKEFSNQIRV